MISPLVAAMRAPLRAKAANSTSTPHPSTPNALINKSISQLDKNSHQKKKNELTTQVKSGESLAKIFKRLNLNHSDLNQLIAASPEKHYFRRLQPGQSLHFRLSQNREVIELTIDENPLENTRFLKQGKRFNHTISSKIRSTETRFASGTIENSLYLAGKKANLNNKLIMDLANIFAWDIDFSQDIRAGDQFEVLYEANVLENQEAIPSKILLARFTNRNRPYTAIEFTDSNNNSRYYTEEGYSMQKTFLRTPVDFARISSHFNLKRKHPILHTIRAHKGVDYAAKTGTPIKATADGRVSFIGRKGGYGKTIILQHHNNITTLYAHLHRFSPNLRKGTKITQGQTIGQVGSTGLASGPHLHYEFRVAGRHKNPVTVKLPNAKPIEVKNKLAFQTRSQQLLAQLKTHEKAQLLAKNTHLHRSKPL